MKLALHRIGLSFLVGFLSAGSALAQPQPPPPPPPRVLLESPPPAPRATGPFESKDGGFKIAFPATPVTQSRESETSFGKATMRVYTLATTAAVYSLVHVDFPTALKDKFDLDTRFDTMRDNQLKRRNGRLIRESEVYFGEHYGRDLVIEETETTHWTRALMIEQRLFVIAIQTRGNYAKQSPALKAGAESRVKKFFDSFSITNIPKAKLTVVELPEQFGVSMAGSTFSSEVLGISFQVPKDWVVLKDSETQLLFELGKEDITKTRPRMAEYLSNANSRILLGVSKTSLETSVTDAIMIVAVEKAPYPNFLAMSAAKTYIGSFLDRTEKVVIEPTIEEIGGIQFAWLETYDSALKLTQRMYFANRKGMALEFALSYTNPADLPPMIRSLATLSAK